MTPKQRIMNAMTNMLPDRVPVMCQLSVGHQIVNSGLSPSEILFDPEGFAESAMRMRQMYNFDGMLNNFTHDGQWKSKVASISKSEAAETIQWKNGWRTVCEYVGNVYWVNEDREKGKKPSLEDTDPDKLEIEPITPDKVAATRIMAEKAGARYSIHGEVSSPFNLCVALFGVEQVMLALMDSPGKCRAIIERCVSREVEHGISHIVNGADAIVVSSPFAGQSLISKAAYREFELPYLRRLIDGLRQYRPGVPIYVHSCGFLGDRLEDAVESGTDGMECLDPPPLGNVELEDAKRRIGGRVFIKGNIDSVNTLLFKSEEGVVQDIRRCIETGMPGGRYILSTACSVAPDVPPSRVKLMAELAEEYGIYKT